METHGLDRHRAWWLMAAILLLIGLGAYALFGRSAAPSSADALRALPEASLIYPGSAVITSGGRNAANGIDGRVSAEAWQLLGVEADPAAIEAFYTTELAARGWTADTHTSSGLLATGELTVVAWSKQGVIFRLGIRDPDSWRADPELFARFQSVYDARLVGDRRADDD
jgi:hypothetical protein